MKKFLLSLLAVAGLSFAASAEQATFDFSKPEAFGYEGVVGSGSGVGYDPAKPLVSGAVTITCDTKDADTNGMLRFWFPSNAATPTDFRCGDGGGKKKQTLTFTANGALITEIAFTTGSFSLTADPGTLASKTWTGSATAVVFTTGGAVQIKSVVVTYTPADPSLKDADLSFGETTEYTAILGESFTAPVLTHSTTAAITYESSNPEVADVNSSTGAVEIKAAGTAMITASSEANAEYNAGSASYTINVVPRCNSLADFYGVGKDNYGYVNFEMLVVYVNGKNCYVITREGGEAGLLFGENSYAAGDVVPAAWVGKYTIYNGLPEIEGSFPVSTETAAVPAPLEVNGITEADINKVVVIKNVVFAEATGGKYKDEFTGTVSSGDITFYNKFTTASVPAGTYDVKVAVGIYKEKLQAYPIEYTEDVSTGIDAVVADENAPVEYYNLQGVRVVNPENGLYIRRQGSKTAKILIK